MGNGANSSKTSGNGGNPKSKYTSKDIPDPLNAFPSQKPAGSKHNPAGTTTYTIKNDGKNTSTYTIRNDGSSKK